MKKGLEFYEVNTKDKPVCRCGKLCLTKQETLFKIKFLTKIRGKESYLRSYHCPLCNMWHLTKNKQEYI